MFVYDIMLGIDDIRVWFFVLIYKPISQLYWNIIMYNIVEKYLTIVWLSTKNLYTIF